MTSDRVDRTGPERYHDGTYLAEWPDWHEGEATWKSEQVLGMLQKHDMKPRSIVDIGCGTAGVLQHLSDNLDPDVRLVGYEIAEHALAIARGRSDRIEVIEGDARSCTEHFDVLLALDVFEHVDDYLGFLRAIRPMADRHIFHIPLDLTVQSVLRMRALLHSRSISGHLHFFTAELALATLADAGFQVIDHDFTRPALELTYPKLRTRLARIPRWLAHRLSPSLAARLLGGFSLIVLAE